MILFNVHEDEYALTKIKYFSWVKKKQWNIQCIKNSVLKRYS